jgi:glycosyltransferase involved in cell wall biosynthesis
MINKLAVIMSVYLNDKHQYLIESIESILNQTYYFFDLYIQCDGPIDSKCEKYLDSIIDKRVFIFKRNYNLGLAKSLNQLLEYVLNRDYEFIARMDADDFCVRNRFELQIDFMETNPDVDIVGGHINEITNNNKFIRKVSYPLNHERMKMFFGRRNPLAHMTVFFRRSFFTKAGVYPENTILDEDTILWYKGFRSNCIFANIDNVLVNVRIDDSFYSRRNGFRKSFLDLKNRIMIIKNLKLSKINYFFALSRFIITSFPNTYITKLAYKYLRV